MLKKDYEETFSSLFITLGSEIADFFILERFNLMKNRALCLFLQPKPAINLNSIRGKLKKFIEKDENVCVILVSKIPYKNGIVDQNKLCELPVIDNSILEQIDYYFTKNNYDEYSTEIKSLPQLKQNTVYIDTILNINTPSKLYSVPSDNFLKKDLESKERNYEKKLSILQGEKLDLSNWSLTLDYALKEAVNHSNAKLTFILNAKERIVETYNSLFLQAKKYLSSLQSNGLKKGDIVILHLDSDMNFIFVFWACILGGIIPLPIPLVKEFNKDDEILSIFPYLKEQLKTLNIITKDEGIIELNRYIRNHFKIPAHILSLKELQNSTDSAYLPILNSSDRVLMIMTSGSTGKPKIVVHTHQSIVARSVAAILNNKFTKEDITLNWFAFDHVGALVMFHIRDVFLTCSQVHVLTSHILENPLRWINYIDEYRVSITWAPNFAYELVINKFEEDDDKHNYDLSYVKFILNGGEAVNVRYARLFINTFADYHLPSNIMHPAWGMSETASGIVYSDQFFIHNTNDSDQYANLGFPIPGCSIRVVDNNNGILGQGENGRLQVKSLSLMQGYLQDINNNKSSFTTDGWFDTGDLATITDMGLIIIGRDKDITIINGKNYSCEKIEYKIKHLSNIVKTSTCVIPIKEIDKSTETIITFIAVKDLSSLEYTLKDVKHAVTQYIGSSPKYVLALEDSEFPKTTIGKIRKSILRKNFIDNKYIKQMEQYDRLFNIEKFVSDWFYEPFWYKKNSINIDDNKISSKTGLIYINSLEHEHQFINILTNHLDSNYLIVEGSEYQENINKFTIDAHRPGDIVNVFHKLANREYIVKQVVYINSNIYDLNNEFTGKYIQSHIENLIYFCQSLCQFYRNNEINFIYLTLFQKDNAVDRANNIMSSPAVALLKSLAVENNKFHFKSINIELPVQEPTIDLILKELDNQSYEQEVAFYNNERYVKGLAHLPIRYLPENNLIAKEGLYIITGGLGAIGYEIAKLLVNQFNASLLLIGRKKIEDIPNAEGKLNYLNRQKNQVFYENVDICNDSLLTKAVSKYYRLFNKSINAIIHTAGIFVSQTFDSIIQQDILKVTNSKIIGTVNLLKLCQQYTGVKLINFSSVNGFFGGNNVSLYAAANAFQDVIAQYNKEKLVLTLSWSMWQKFGMSKHVDFEELTKSRGFEILNIQQSLASFILALNFNKPHVLIGLNKNNRFITQYDNNNVYNLESIVTKTKSKTEQFKIKDSFGKTFLIENELLKQNEFIHNKSYSNQDSLTKVQNIWKEILKLEEVGLNDNFFDLGGHSLLIPKLQAELKSQLNLDIKAVDIFKYPTINSFVGEFLTIKKNNLDNIIKVISEMWQKKLMLDDIGYDENYFDLGAHSLMMPAVQSYLNDYFNIKLNIVDFFKHPNVNSLAEYISNLLALTETLPNIPKHDINQLKYRKQNLLRRQKNTS